MFNHWNFLNVDFLWRPRQIWGVFSNAHQTLVLQRRLNCLDGAECFSNTVQSLGIWSRRRFVFYVSGLRRWSWGKTQTCFGCRPLLFLVVERFYVLLQNAFMFWLITPLSAQNSASKFQNLSRIPLKKLTQNFENSLKILKLTQNFKTHSKFWKLTQIFGVVVLWEELNDGYQW